MELTEISAPIAPLLVGEVIDLTITATNQSGNTTGPVSLSLDATDEATGERQPAAIATIDSIGAHGTSTTSIGWDTEGLLPGFYTLRIAAFANGDTDDTNNAIDLSVELVNALTIVEVSPKTATVIVGDALHFSVQVKNLGNVELKDVAVSLFETNGKRKEAVASTVIDAIAAGATSLATLKWDTARQEVDNRSLAIVVSADGQAGDENDAQWITAHLRNPITLTATVGVAASLAAGNSVSIEATVANASVEDVSGVVVNLYAGDPAEAVSTDAIDTIPAGGTAPAHLVWYPAGVASGEHMLHVVASAPDFAEDIDDSVNVIVSLEEPVVDVAFVGGMTAPAAIVVGKAATVSASLTNLGNKSASASVSLYAGAATEPVATTDTAAIEPGSTEGVTMVWTTAGPASLAGPRQLRLTAHVPEDASLVNNTITLPVNFYLSAFDNPDAPEECVDDVGVDLAIYAIEGPLADPPDYRPDESLYVSYQIYNYSCDTDALVNVDLTTVHAGVSIVDSTDVCRARCLVPAGGRVEREVLWPLTGIPYTIDETAQAAIAVSSPQGFADADAENNTVIASQHINIVPADDITLGFGTAEGSKGHLKGELNRLEVNRLAPTLTTDVELVSMVSTPPVEAMPGQVVEIRVAVQNNGSAPVNVPIWLTFPSEDKKPELKSSRVLPGKTAVASFTWKTANYKPGLHVLRADLLLENNLASGNASAELLFRLNPPATRATILNISTTPDTPVVGEAVSIAVEVRNDGAVSANIPVTLHFPSADKQPETRRPRIPPGATATATFTWRTGDYLPGRHHFRVEVPSTAPADRRFAVQLLPVPINVAIAGIGADPAESAVRGERVKIWVAVRNDGAVATRVPVELAFPSYDKKPERKSLRIAPGQTARVTFTWKTGNYKPGLHVLRAALLLEDNLASGATSAELPFRIKPPVTRATILEISTAPDAPVVGEAVAVTVLVRNDAAISASIPVTLHFPAADKQPETRRPRIAPGATATATFTWRTGNYLPGRHHFRVEVPSTAPADRRFAVQLLPVPINVSIVGIGADPAEGAARGERVKIWVAVRNDGSAPVNVPIRLTFPSEDKKPERKSSRVLPGKTTVASFTWKTGNYKPGLHVLRAELLLENNLAPGAASAELPFRIKPPVTRATILNISTAPDTPVVGEAVAVTVLVRNDGAISASIPVTLHFPSADKQPETRRPRIPPGATATATFTWRTGDYLPGRHYFRVEVPSTAPADRRFAVQLLPVPINVAIAGIGAHPAESAVRGAEVEIRVTVQNNGSALVNAPIRLTFPSEDKKPELKSSRVLPGKTAVASFTWKTGNYEPGLHVLRAELLLEDNLASGATSAELQFRINPPVTRATILNISTAPDTPVVGEAVAVTVLVRNDGAIAANIPVTLHFPAADKQPETRSPRIPPGATATATFTWRTGDYLPGRHYFRVEVPSTAPADRRFAVQLLPAPVNVSVVGIGADPADTAVRGEVVEIWVAVRNDGAVATRVPVELAFPSYDKKPERKSLRIAPGQTARATFTWKTGNYEPGLHVLRAELLLEDNLASGATSAELQFRINPPVTRATILNISTAPDTPVVGEAVAVTVLVRNDAAISASISVTLHFPAADKQPETRSPQIPPGATATATFTWRTGDYLPGQHHFRVEVPSTAPADRRFAVQLRPVPINVSIVGIGADPAESAVRGERVKIWVAVRNDGAVATRVPVELAFPSYDKKPERKSLRIAPGQTARVTFTWKTANYEPGPHTLVAALLSEDNITAGDRSAQLQFLLTAPAKGTPAGARAGGGGGAVTGGGVGVTPAPKLPVPSPGTPSRIVAIEARPRSTVVGEPVTITVEVSNDGPAVASIPITLHFPSADKRPETRRPRVAPGTTRTATFIWRTSRYAPGRHHFRVEVGAGALSRRSFTVELLPPAADFAVVDIYPPSVAHPVVKGDWVEVAALVRNLGPHGGRSAIHLYNETERKVMYRKNLSLAPGESEIVGFTWKTLRYTEGENEIFILSNAAYDENQDNDRSPTAMVNILTNRDITVGFGSGDLPDTTADTTSVPTLRTTAVYLNEILVLGSGSTPAGGVTLVPPSAQIGTQPQRIDDADNPTAIHRLRQSAQTSATDCVRLQSLLGQNQPRGVLCPKAPALIR